MPKIFLRWDQSKEIFSNPKFQNSEVVIFAPDWVELGLQSLSSKIPSVHFNVYDGGGQNIVDSLLLIENEISLHQLIAISRNEPLNISGLIQLQNYAPDISDEEVIYSLKDLTRQCVIVGKDNTTHYGGYPRGKPILQEEDIYIIDLAGLQFQRNYNSGRLVLIGEAITKGFLDKLIFKNVVGEEKKSFEEAEADTTGRYEKILSQNLYLDSFAYRRFVTNDFVLAALAVNEVANDELNFKFLKYGTGYFAGSYEMRTILDKHITEGVKEGIRILFSSHKPDRIKSIELPFYNFDQELFDMCKEFGVECIFSKNDALMKTHPRYVTATTNCGDPHVVLGNEMGYSSVDAAIGQNLETKGCIFSPNINKKMKFRFIPLKTNRVEVNNEL